ncbi:MAG: Bug family tripartite tricarboxylate transporter substrate binding protein [Xanthobacteraceae bacterium]
MKLIVWLGLMLAGALVATEKASAQARADDFPSRNITFLCPFPAGGGTDILTRMLAQELQEKLGRTVIVENRPGAGTIIAAQAAARAVADGHTIFLAPITTLAIAPNVHKSLPYDPIRDFQPVGLVGSAQFALVANRALGAATLPDLIAQVRRSDGSMSFASSGSSTPHRLFMEMLLKMTGTKAQHVAYRGSVAALTDVISGQIPFMIVDLAVAMGAIAEGKVKAYGVTSATRVNALPDLPTIAEAGVPGYGASGWFSVVAPAGTPAVVVDKLNAVLMSFLDKPAAQDRMNALAITPMTSTPDELRRFIPDEIAKWAKVVKGAGIVPE